MTSKFPGVPKSTAANKPNYPAHGSVEVTERKSGEAPVRRHPLHKDKLVQIPKEGVTTVTDVLLHNARIHGTARCYGWRDIVKTVEEEKEITKTINGNVTKEMKKWKYFQLSEFKWMNAVEVKDFALDLSKGLIELGVEKSSVFNIYASTSPSWQLMQHACMAAGLTIATAYDTLGEEGLTHSLSEPDCVGVFTNADLLPTLLRVLPNTPTVKIIVYDGTPSQEILDKLKGEEGSERKVLSQTELRELGKGKPEQEARYPKPEDVACIMYTSGTTGAPKGVVLTQSMLIGAVASVQEMFGHHLVAGKDTFLAFLPLAHILEYVVELSLSYLGLALGYGRIKTLTDASVRNCRGDLIEMAPTIMVGVPAIWETIRKGVMTKVSKMSTIKKNVFKGSLAIKKAGVPVLSQVVDQVVFSQVRANTGGNLKFVLSGGAALSSETQAFLSAALVTVLQGYGLTESCGMCTILPPEYMTLGSVGIPSPSVEIKLLDVPEAGYKTSATIPQGEILIRGVSVTKGYFKRDDLNKDPTIFTDDGWFRTGDVGQWNKDGTLSIIDRVKNLVKLTGGEYIALERLETTYKTSHYIANLCIHATSESKQPIAIIFPHELHLKDALSNPSNSHLGLPSPDSDIHKLCEDKAVKEFILKDLQAIAKKQGFKGIEVVQGVVLTPDEWTPESGMVTAAQKVQRKNVERSFIDEIRQCYKDAQGEYNA